MKIGAQTKRNLIRILEITEMSLIARATIRVMKDEIDQNSSKLIAMKKKLTKFESKSAKRMTKILFQL